ncbi:MAG: hypothetical protein OEQ47_17345, partial [Acidimicrobiia bacterium]|nr:hypothetical protein [Acidimicrobiia bacterium]
MDRTNPIEHQDETTGAVTVDGTTIRLDGFVFDDPTLASLLADLSAERRIEMVGRVLTVGARGLVTMGLGVDLGEVDERVRTAVRQAAEEAERRFTTTVNDASRAMSGQLDPNLRDSLVARSLEDFTEWRDDFLAALDPNSVDSHTRLLLENLESLVGPDGLMETRLHAMLDPSGEESALGQLGDSITRQLADLRDLIMV